MYLLFNKYLIYIINLKILIVFSNFNNFFSNILLNNFCKKLFFLGFKKNNILIFSILGSLEFLLIFNFFLKKIFFDLCIILGLIIKNKTFHFEIISLSSIFFIINISYNSNIPIINFLFTFSNKYFFLFKILKINNINLKNFLKFINFLFFINKLIFNS